MYTRGEPGIFSHVIMIELGCLPHPYTLCVRRVWHVPGMDSEFVKFFQQNRQKPPFAKVQCIR